MTGFHYPSTRAINSASGNRALVSHKPYMQSQNVVVKLTSSSIGLIYLKSEPLSTSRFFSRAEASDVRSIRSITQPQYIESRTMSNMLFGLNSRPNSLFGIVP